MSAGSSGYGYLSRSGGSGSAGSTGRVSSGYGISQGSGGSAESSGAASGGYGNVSLAGSAGSGSGAGSAAAASSASSQTRSLVVGAAPAFQLFCLRCDSSCGGDDAEKAAGGSCSCVCECHGSRTPLTARGSEGEYVAWERLGDGAFATTYRCTEKRIFLQRPPRPSGAEAEAAAAAGPGAGRDPLAKALKCLKGAGRSCIPEEYAEGSFECEQELLRALRHPLIPALWDAFEFHRRRAYVMDLIEGQSVARELADRGPARPFPPGEVLGMLEDLSDALLYVHAKGLVHRDVSPSNIVRRPAGGGGQAPGPRPARFFLIDFGIATTTGRSDYTSVGPANFAAPEQVEDPPEPGPYSDVYSLGRVAACMLLGSPRPPQQRLWRQLAAERNVPPRLVDLVEAMTRHVYTERLQSASDVRRAAGFDEADFADGPGPGTGGDDGGGGAPPDDFGGGGGGGAGLLPPSGFLPPPGLQAPLAPPLRREDFGPPPPPQPEPQRVAQEAMQQMQQQAALPAAQRASSPTPPPQEERGFEAGLSPAGPPQAQQAAPSLLDFPPVELQQQQVQQQQRAPPPEAESLEDLLPSPAREAGPGRAARQPAREEFGLAAELAEAGERRAAAAPARHRRWSRRAVDEEEAPWADDAAAAFFFEQERQEREEEARPLAPPGPLERRDATPPRRRFAGPPPKLTPRVGVGEVSPPDPFGGAKEDTRKGGEQAPRRRPRNSKRQVDEDEAPRAERGAAAVPGEAKEKEKEEGPGRRASGLEAEIARLALEEAEQEEEEEEGEEDKDREEEEEEEGMFAAKGGKAAAAAQQQKAVFASKKAPAGSGRARARRPGAAPPPDSDVMAGALRDEAEETPTRLFTSARPPAEQKEATEKKKERPRPFEQSAKLAAADAAPVPRKSLASRVGAALAGLRPHAKKEAAAARPPPEAAAPKKPLAATPRGGGADRGGGGGGLLLRLRGAPAAAAGRLGPRPPLPRPAPGAPKPVPPAPSSSSSASPAPTSQRRAAERGEALEKLELKAESLAEGAAVFQRHAAAKSKRGPGLFGLAMPDLASLFRGAPHPAKAHPPAPGPGPAGRSRGLQLPLELAPAEEAGALLREPARLAAAARRLLLPAPEAPRRPCPLPVCPAHPRGAQDGRPRRRILEARCWRWPRATPAPSPASTGAAPRRPAPPEALSV
eukprot:tig00000849_g4772.t1